MGVLKHDGEPFELTMPVCIVGGGACGLTAGIAAAEEGAEVAVFEMDATPTGATSMSISLICAAGTRLQAELGVEDSVERLVQDIMSAARGQTDEDLVRFLAEESAPAVDWLCDLGLDLHLETSWRGYGHSQLRCHGTPNNNGAELMAMLLNLAESKGVHVITRSRVTDLILGEGERIVGLKYETPDGGQLIGCEAVVLASSGFGANRELVARYIPEMADAEYYGCENHLGDAILWGRELSAEMGDLGSYQGLGTVTPYGFAIPHSILIDGAFKVNGAGERYEHELLNLSGQALNAMAQPGGHGWLIFDQTIHDRAAATFSEYRDSAHLIQQACKASSLDELAEKTGIGKAGLEQTFASIQKSIDTGKPAALGRTFNSTRALKPPYFALRVFGAIVHTQGGLCIDRQARVRKQGGGVFDNLYAGGGAVRSVSGPGEWGYIPAIGLCTAVTFGRVAGRSAAKLALATVA